MGINPRKFFSKILQNEIKPNKNFPDYGIIHACTEKYWSLIIRLFYLFIYSIWLCLTPVNIGITKLM